MDSFKKKRFPNKKYAKHQPRADGPFKIVTKINDNAYKVELLDGYRVLETFNISDLSPYHDDEPLDFRTSLLQPGENDAHKQPNMSPLEYANEPNVNSLKKESTQFGLMVQK